MATKLVTLEFEDFKLAIDSSDDAVEMLQLEGTQVAAVIENEDGEPLVLETVDLRSFEPSKRASGIMKHLYPFLSDDSAAMAAAVKEAESIDKVVEDMFNDIMGQAL